MLRAPVRNGATPRRPGEEDDICPVCKSSRYLNPNMRFLVNPECYHKMCESCVDRIFSQGPAPCPVAGCARTLRKQRFRKQTFDDIHIEREVDIRRRVAQVFNRRQSEFATLLDYNNYLEEVETLTFNLLHNIDVAATESLLATHAAQNSAAISHNALLSGQESASATANQSAQRDATRARRDAARHEEEAEKRERDDNRRDLVEEIARSASGDADAVAAREGQKVVLKKSTARRTVAEKAWIAAAGTAAAGDTRPTNTTTTTTTSKPGANGSSADALTYTIKGLKPVVPASPEKPYSPFGGLARRPRYHVPRDSYEHPWLERARADPQMGAGGYDLGEYCRRAVVEAFAGLGCFVAEEVAAREGGKGVSEGAAETA